MFEGGPQNTTLHEEGDLGPTEPTHSYQAAHFNDNNPSTNSRIENSQIFK